MNDPLEPQEPRRSLASEHPLKRGALDPAYTPAADPHTGHEPFERPLHLWDYGRILRRRKWTAVLCLVTALGAAAAWTFSARPMFTASALLRIERDEPRILKFEEVVKADSDEDYFQTQHNLLKSRSLANRVIEVLALDKHPEFGEVREGRTPGWRTAVETWVREQVTGWWPADGAALEREAAEGPAQESPLTRAFLDRLHVSPITNTRLVRISFDSHEPTLAPKVVNALAEVFITRNLDHKTEASRFAIQFLSKQLDEVRDRLEESETRLSEFLALHDIHFVTPERVGDRQDLVSQQLVSLSDSVLRARAERIAKESTLRQALSQDPTSVPAVLNSGVVARLKAELVGLESERRQLGQTYQPSFEDPRIRELDENIRALRQELAQETRKIIESLENDYRTAVQAERRFERAVEDQRQVARRLGGQMVQYGLLRREVESNRDLFGSLLGQLKETGVSAALVTSNVSVVDPGEVPLSPSKPKKGLNFALAGFLGLFGGVALALLREYLDTTVKDAREVESTLGVPALALIPSWTSLASRRERREATFALAAHARAASPLAEAFRTLRASLLYSLRGGELRSVLLTSLQRDDGKTSLATNLAIVLAQLDVGEVVLVDADMRRPRIHELLGVSGSGGLSRVLAGQMSLSDVVQPTSVPNLYVLPAGEVPLNPAERLSSARLKETLGLLRAHFAYTVVDTPPLGAVSDAMILAAQVDGVALVLRRGRTNREAALRAIRAFAAMRARLLGVILNDVDVRKVDGVEAAGYYQYGPGGSRAAG